MLLRGVSGVGTLFPPTARPWGKRPGPAARFLWARGLQAWGPSPNPQRTLLRAGFANCRGGPRALRGGHLVRPRGVSGVGHSPFADHLSFKRAAGAPCPVSLGAGGWERGNLSPTPLRTLFRTSFARCGHSMRTLSWGASCLGEGFLGLVTLPPPVRQTVGQRAGARCPFFLGAGCASVETRHQPHSARSCELALRAVRAARGRPGGGRIVPL